MRKNDSSDLIFISITHLHHRKLIFLVDPKSFEKSCVYRYGFKDIQTTHEKKIKKNRKKLFTEKGVSLFLENIKKLAWAIKLHFT